MVYRVAVAGASGYAGGELVRILASHPDLEVVTVTANSNAGKPIGSVHPNLASLDLTLKETNSETLSGYDVVFLALPHGSSGALGDSLDAGLVVDCGADHRLTDKQDWDDYYGGSYSGAWAYGMPELADQRIVLKPAKRIAVPGCNATAVTLAFAPLISAGLIETEDLVSVLAVGTSGAGKALSEELLATEILGGARAYAVGGVHRHNPEIRQNLRLAGAANISLSFTPALVPMSRGILATNTARLKPGVGEAECRTAFEKATQNEPFLNLLPKGVQPRTVDTLGTNNANFGIEFDERAGRVVVSCALDNLGKGTAGAAIQSANLALGISEATGLSTIGVTP